MASFSFPVLPSHHLKGKCPTALLFLASSGHILGGGNTSSSTHIEKDVAPNSLMAFSRMPSAGIKMLIVITGFTLKGGACSNPSNYI